MSFLKLCRVMICLQSVPSLLSLSPPRLIYVLLVFPLPLSFFCSSGFSSVSLSSPLPLSSASPSIRYVNILSICLLLFRHCGPLPSTPSFSIPLFPSPLSFYFCLTLPLPLSPLTFPTPPSLPPGSPLKEFIAKKFLWTMRENGSVAELLRPLSTY